MPVSPKPRLPQSLFGLGFMSKPLSHNAKSVGSFSRLMQIRRVIKKHGLASLFDEVELTGSAKAFIRIMFGKSTAPSANRGQRIREALEELGPVFVKLGQALSTRPDLLPHDIAIELTNLQDKVPPFSAQISLDIIKQAYGDELDNIFSHIDEQPLASASVAQVHSAVLKKGLAISGQDGKKSDQVIIKVIRPGIEAIINSDLKVMHAGAKFLQRYWSREKQFRPLDVIQEYDHTIRDELDLRNEAANGARMGADFEDSDLIYVPRIYWDYTQENVLVMERIHGTSIREFESLQNNGVDLKSLAEDGVGVFFKQAFEDNFFHADMHAGNIFVSDQGKWIAIDFGIMGTLNDSDQRYLGEILLGFFNRDYGKIADAHIRSGWVPEATKKEEFEQAIRVVCEPIFAKPLSEISFGNVLMQLFQTVRRFEMPVQPQLVLLYKTLLNIEGLGRQLYPNLNLWDTAKPFLENWMKQQLSPQKLIEDLQRDWPQWQQAFRQLPAAIENAAQASQTSDEAPVANSTTQNLGLTAIFLSLGGTLAEQYSLIDFGDLSHVLPWLGLVGLIVLLKRQSS